MKASPRPSFTYEVCILAGGLSQRMGRDKAGLRFGHRTMLEQIRAAAKQLGVPVRIIRRDLVARCGPLGGVYTALKSSGAEVLIFLACDMPFVSAELLRRMLVEFVSAQNPLFTRYRSMAGFPFILRREVLSVIEQQLAKSEFSLQKLARALSARHFRPSRAFVPQLRNINTPRDWGRACRLWQRSGKISKAAGVIRSARRQSNDEVFAKVGLSKARNLAIVKPCR